MSSNEVSRFNYRVLHQYSFGKPLEEVALLFIVKYHPCIHGGPTAAPILDFTLEIEVFSMLLEM